MEGTRHEKIALIVIAYVIGFTSAFIAFGVNDASQGSQQLHIENTLAIQNQATAVHHSELSVGVSQEGLFAITKDKERILSANKDLYDEVVDIEGPTPGFFYNIIEAEASRDGNYVYFCEQLMESNVYCDSYVYSIKDDTLYRVSFEGENIQPIIPAHDSRWTGDSTLVINGAMSTDASQPWKLSTVTALSQ